MPKTTPSNETPVKDGDHCRVTGGTHKGKSGTVRDLNISKTGHLTITVVQKNGDRFKTLARNVQIETGNGAWPFDAAHAWPRASSAAAPRSTAFKRGWTRVLCCFALSLGPGVTPANAEPGDLMVDVVTPSGAVVEIDDPALTEMLGEGLRGEHHLTLVPSDRALTD